MWERTRTWENLENLSHSPLPVTFYTIPAKPRGVIQSNINMTTSEAAPGAETSCKCPEMRGLTQSHLPESDALSLKRSQPRFSFKVRSSTTTNSSLGDRFRLRAREEKPRK
jgi:hypothetical protein